MRRLLRAFAAAIGLAVLPLGGTLAQDEDAGFLERQIQNALGGEGRDVRVVGLSGALSSQASIERIEVADADGVWLTISDVRLDWRRVALLRRRLQVNALTVGSVDIARPPLPGPGEPPKLAAEAEPEPFSLPQLPVSVNVDEVAVDSLALGAPVLGEAVEMSIEGAAQLAGGEGSVELSVVRTDGHDSRYRLVAGYDNDTQQTRVDLELSEAEGGLIGTLSGMPGEPPLSLTVEGDAPLDDFTAEIDFRTEGTQRLAGTVSIADDDTDGAERRITADVDGDVAELFLPDYRPFFGPRVALEIEALQGAGFGLDLRTLSLTTQGMTLTGTARLNEAYLPRTVDLTADLGTASGLPVVLPLSGPPVLVNRGTLEVTYDEAEGDTFTADFDADGVMRADGLLIDRLALVAEGMLDKAGPTSVRGVRADVTADVAGFSSTDPALWDASSS